MKQNTCNRSDHLSEYRTQRNYLRVTKGGHPVEKRPVGRKMLQGPDTLHQTHIIRSGRALGRARSGNSTIVEQERSSQQRYGGANGIVASSI